MIRRPSRRPRRPRRLAAVLAAAAASAGLALAAQPPVSSGAGGPLLEVAELPVEVLDAEGLPAAEVAAEDLVLVAGGAPRPVLEVSREPRPWRVVLYFDADLAAGPTLPRAAGAFEAQAGALTALGEVEVLLAADGVRTVLPPTRDPAMLASALARLSLFERGRDRLVELRRAAAEERTGGGAAGVAPGEAEEESGAEGAVAPGETDEESGAAPGGGASPREGAGPAGGGSPIAEGEADLAGRAAAGEWSSASAGAGSDLTADELAVVEADFVRGRLDLLLERLAEPWRGTADGPAAVFWIGDGFDLDPTAWRRAPAGAEDTGGAPEGREAVAGVPAQTAPTSASPSASAAEGAVAAPGPDRPARSEAAAGAASSAPSPPEATPPSAAPIVSASGAPLLAPAAETARALAALGWTVVPVTLRTLDPAAAPGRWGGGELQRPDGTTVPVTTVRLPDRTPEQRAADILAADAPPPPVPVAPDEPLALFAAASGGHLVGSAAGIGTTIERLAARLRLRYAALPGEAGEPRPMTVAAAEGLRVAARRWTMSPSPPALAALRARRLLDGAHEPGPLEVQAAVLVGSAAAGGGGGEAAVEIEVGGLAAPPNPELRLTFATVGDDGLPRLEQRRLPARPARAAAAEGHPSSSPSAIGAPASPAVDLPPSAPGDTWTWRGTLHLPASADRVAVLVEEPRSGAWGGALAGVVDLASSAASAGWDAAAGVLPGPGAVHLLRPEGAMLAGRVRFETVVAPDVARVELRLDGRRAAVVAAAPFAAVLDLGRLPLPRRVEAIAFDAAGGELGRDETTVNGGSGRLRVRLVEPAGGRAVGLVTVAAEVEVPEGRRLDRVELYWRDRRVATLFQPPFRHRLTVPPEAPQGLLRAVARTLDGGEAEDAVLLNGAGPAERVDVALTELYVVAGGADGRPVRGLSREDFVVREDGRAQEIATFGDASELPLTLGLALDSSASMFVKLPEVREAALAVLDDLVPGRDQAFLVDFDDRARLAAGPTRDLGRLRAAARALEPDGRTSLWEAVVFSLVQLQGAAGRRALLLYSDGADEDGDLGFDTALDFARRVGVPVYAIVANAEAVRLGGLDLGILPSLGGRIERIAEATGGRAWVVRRGDDLAPYYAEIREELAAQYRLGYYPPAGGDGSWRRVEVEVRRPGVRARTVAGYRR